MTRTGFALSCFLFLLLTSAGCSNGQRLGESRVEARRYSGGWHVNTPNGRAVQARRVMEEEPDFPPTRPALPVGELTHPLATNHTEDAMTVTAGVEGVIVGETMAQHQGKSHFHRAQFDRAQFDRTQFDRTQFDRAQLDGAQAGRAQVHRAQPERAPGEASLPEPQRGRHPDAVLGFVLSAGWVYGLLGAIALDYLAAFSLVGFAFALGFILSILGYSLSRRAFRMSKANPDRYPRSGLASAGRWVAGAIIMAALLWLAFVLFLLLTW